MKRDDECAGLFSSSSEEALHAEGDGFGLDIPSGSVLVPSLVAHAIPEDPDEVSLWLRVHRLESSCDLAFAFTSREEAVSQAGEAVAQAWQEARRDSQVATGVAWSILAQHRVLSAIPAAPLVRTQVKPRLRIRRQAPKLEIELNEKQAAIKKDTGALLWDLIIKWGGRGRLGEEYLALPLDLRPTFQEQCVERLVQADVGGLRAALKAC